MLTVSRLSGRDPQGCHREFRPCSNVTRALTAINAIQSKYGKNQWARISSLLVRKTPKQCKVRPRPSAGRRALLVQAASADSNPAS